MSLKVVFITGAARRIGRAIAECVHQAGYSVVLHHHQSKTEAHELAEKFNQDRPHSALTICGDLQHCSAFPRWIKQTIDHFGRLDALINNASCFYRTPIDEITEEMFDHTMTVNLKSAFFLTQAAKPYLLQTQGNIVNITDVKSMQPLKHYSLYCMAKSGLWMMTKALALECAPHIRVNAVAPGAMIWPEGSEALSDEVKATILKKIPLHRLGSPEHIAKTVYFLMEPNSASYITGQMICVDGGRSI